MPSKFRESLWDDSEPDYAPFMRKIRSSYYWVPSQSYVDAGWVTKTVRLEGQVGDGMDLDRAAHCRALTRDLMTWFDGISESRIEAGTWGWLIQRYIHDEASAIWDVRASTRAKYRDILNRVSDAISDVRIEDTTFEVLISWQRAMEKNGRSRHYIKQWFTHFGLAVSHGVKIGADGCARVKAIRGEMRIKNPPKRTMFATPEDVASIVAAADKAGQSWLSLSLLLRFEFILRGVDVYGEWAPSEGHAGGITHNGKHWQRGLTWDMFARDLTYFEKVISKTEDSLPEAYRFDLTATPDIRRRLMAIPHDKRTGPVIVLPDGTPPKDGVITRAFKAHVRSLGLDPRLQIRDARSGGATEAKSLADPFALRDAMQHTQISTTDIYLRGRSDSANKVVSIRQAARGSK